jgi:L-ascorbate metabolism protein UlaG (beta-lactamase superfamily)
VIEPFLSDQAFLDDVDAAPAAADSCHLWWLGQSGFLVQWNGHRLLLDPYLSDSLTRKYASTEKPHVRMTRRVVDPERLAAIEVITSTHGHTDHLDAETLRAVRAGAMGEAIPRAPRLVAPRAIDNLVRERWGMPPDAPLDDREAWTHLRSGITFEGVAAAHDTIERNDRGWCKYLGFLIRCGPFILYHSGDTVVYPGLAERLSRHHVDLAILPINGKVGNMNGADAARLAREIGAKLVIPCHYEMFEFNTASPYELFAPECERLGQPYKVLRAGERLTLTR